MPLQPSPLSPALSRFAATVVLVVACAFTPAGAEAAEAIQGLEQALQTALQDKRGITLYVNGQTISGAVARIEAGQWVELRNQQHGRILVRLDRIDGIAAP